MTSKITGQTKVVSGKTYYEAVNTYLTSNLSQLGFFSNQDHKYTMRMEDPSTGVNIEVMYLVDNKNVGETWTAPISESGSINGVPGQIIGKMMEKDISKTVNGKTFTHVIHTQLELQYKFFTDFETVATYDYYIAKGVGYIENDITMFSIPYGNIKITGYEIK